MSRYLLSTVITAILLMFGISYAGAATEYTTIESVVEVERDRPVRERVVRITGPDRIVYRVEAPVREIERITEVIEERPQTVISFRGEVLDDNGSKVFRVKDWNETTVTKTDSRGNIIEQSQTVTRTEEIR